jgi:hypothetical protein
MNENESLLKAFINGGWIIPLIGASAMIARLLSSSTELNFLEQLKRIVAAALSATIAWFVLEQTDIPSLYKAITYGVIGVVSPEIINGTVKLARSFQRNPRNFIKK